MNESFSKQVAAAVVAYFVLALIVGQDPTLKAWIQRQWSPQ